MASAAVLPASNGAVSIEIDSDEMVGLKASKREEIASPKNRSGCFLRIYV
jgi:hypothetical protein